MTGSDRPGLDEIRPMRRPAVYVVAAVTILALGGSWPVMGLGVEAMPALWLGTVRLLGGALVLALGLAVTGRLHLPRRADVAVVLTYGVLRLGMVYVLVFGALTVVPPGRSSVLVYTSSLWAPPMAWWFLKEPITPARVVGALAGGAGIVVMVRPWSLDLAEPAAAVGYGMLILAAVVSAAATVYIRNHVWHSSPLALLPWQLAVAALVAMPVAVVLEGAPAIGWNLPNLLILTYQVLIAAAFGAWGLITISRSLPAMTTSLLLMAVPAVGLGSSVMIGLEPLTADVVLGLLLVLGGVAAGIVADDRGTPIHRDRARPELPEA